MGCCTGRCLLITICVLQLVSTIERQVFDFLGYMWVPIIGNFLQIIFVIVGFFGAVQYRPKVLVAYSVWSLVWLGWNVFIICYYLEVGILSRDSSILNLGTGNKSWWLDNGIGCYVDNSSSLVSSSVTQSVGSNPQRHVPPEEQVKGCLIEYYYVEVIHAGLQCLFCLLGFFISCYVIYVFTEEDDSSFWESQPVHDELEYIKMRYRSPARISFRDNKTYETLATRSTYTTGSTIERAGTLEAPHSDDSIDRPHHQQTPQSGENKYVFTSDAQQQHAIDQTTTTTLPSTELPFIDERSPTPIRHTDASQTRLLPPPPPELLYNIHSSSSGQSQPSPTPPQYTFIMAHNPSSTVI